MNVGNSTVSKWITQLQVERQGAYSKSLPHDNSNRGHSTAQMNINKCIDNTVSNGIRPEHKEMTLKFEHY